MTNKFKEGRESKNKKLLVPVLALFLCATALIGVGYAAVVSSVSVTGNDIGVSHVYIDFEANTEGTFSSSADTIDAGSRIIDGVTYYDLNETGTYVIGKAILKLDAAVYTT
ncbi:MAG TPA: hypothetical protein VJX93_03230, partial [Candidatus Methanomethylophilaceae archaeon]|nr:hypothetical protein [Candidatus Methanomethylophilaceae archaeon]